MVSPVEPDAVVQPIKRQRGRAASYKPSVLCNNKRVILAHEVDPSNEASVIDKLLEQSKRVSGDKVGTLMLDGGYFCNAVLETAIDQDINLLCPGHREKTRKKAGKKFGKYEFTYDALNDVYICPAGDLLKPGPIGEKKYTMYRTPACKTCPMRTQCTTAEAGRRIRRMPGDELKEAQREVMSHPGAKKEFKQRQAMVEPVFSYLQQIQHLRRFKRRGLAGVKLEFAIHSSAYNLRRAVAALVATVVVFVSTFLARAHLPLESSDS